jgi:hypothetical protein
VREIEDGGVAIGVVGDIGDDCGRALSRTRRRVRPGRRRVNNAGLITMERRCFRRRGVVGSRWA